MSILRPQLVDKVESAITAESIYGMQATKGLPYESHMKGSHIKSFTRFFQKIAVSKGGAFVRCPQTAKYPLLPKDQEGAWGEKRSFS